LKEKKSYGKINYNKTILKVKEGKDNEPAKA